MSKKKRKKRGVPGGWDRVVVVGGDPKMSEVILDLELGQPDGTVDAMLIDLLRLKEWSPFATTERRLQFDCDLPQAVEFHTGLLLGC